MPLKTQAFTFLTIKPWKCPALELHTFLKRSSSESFLSPALLISWPCFPKNSRAFIAAAGVYSWYMCTYILCILFICVLTYSLYTRCIFYTLYRCRRNLSECSSLVSWIPVIPPCLTNSGCIWPPNLYFYGTCCSFYKTRPIYLLHKSRNCLCGNTDRYRFKDLRCPEQKSLFVQNKKSPFSVICKIFKVKPEDVFQCWFASQILNIKVFTSSHLKCHLKEKCLFAQSWSIDQEKHKKILQTCFFVLEIKKQQKESCFAILFSYFKRNMK